VNSRHVRAYSALLRIYPRGFRADYRREMTLLFAEQLQDARVTAGGLGVVRLWVRSVVDLVATAPAEHLDREAVVAQSVVGIEHPRPGRGGVSSREWIVAALLPPFLILFLFFAAPHFLDPMSHKAPSVLGQIGRASCRERV